MILFRKIFPHLPIILIIALAAAIGWAAEPTHFEKHGHDHQEVGGSKFGPGQAVSERGPLGFRLSPEAAKTLSLTFEDFDIRGARFSCKAIVLIRGEKFIFRSRDRWFKKENIGTPSQAGSRCTFRSSTLKAGDQIVVQGAGLLRLTEIFLTEEATHSH